MLPLTVTGDFAGTAAAIARQVGIITATGDKVHSAADLSISSESEKAEPVEPVEPAPGPKAVVLSGSELLQLTEEQWRAVIKVPRPLLRSLHSADAHFHAVRRARLRPHNAAAEAADRQAVPGRW